MKIMKKAFTLIEISVAIAVIGILLSLVIISQEFISDARMKRMIGEIAQMKTNVKSFYNIYGELPGDAKRASTYFDGGVNGNDDDEIEFPNESYNAMVHLFLAGIIDGYYAADSYNYTYKSNFTEGAAIRLLYTNDFEGFLTNKTNVFQIGRANHCDDAIFTPLEAKMIDTKFDNSKPNTGNITYRAYGTTTALSCTNNSDDYYVAYQEPGCNLVMNLDI